jgi:ribosome biogenesis GTPase
VTECRILPPLTPITGDWAVARDSSAGQLALHHVLPRTTVVLRQNATSTGEQPLVANVDATFLLHGIDRPHRVGRLERLAILSWEVGVRPLIVLTKIDLEGTSEAVIGVSEAVAEINKILHDIEVIPVSSATGEGIEQLEPHLPTGQTIGLLGESGAGKSSLINHLAGERLRSTARTRPSDHKGRHTTTSRALVPVPGGAVLVDTPGLRSVSMVAANTGLRRAYADLEAIADECRFRNCSHGVEPGCKIQAAIDDGLLAPERLSGYQKLHREMKFEAKRAEERARRAKSRTSRRRRREVPEADEW